MAVVQYDPDIEIKPSSKPVGGYCVKCWREHKKTGVLTSIDTQGYRHYRCKLCPMTWTEDSSYDFGRYSPRSEPQPISSAGAARKCKCLKRATRNQASMKLMQFEGRKFFLCPMCLKEEAAQ